MFDFNSIVTANGFTYDSYDFESTIVGFDYDIQFALFDERTIFDMDRSRCYRQWDNPNAFLRCELVPLSGSVDDAVHFIHHRWWTELRYERPLWEVIDLRQRDGSATIHVLTITHKNAMTLLLNITTGDT